MWKANDLKGSGAKPLALVPVSDTGEGSRVARRVPPVAARDPEAGRLRDEETRPSSRMGVSVPEWMHSNCSRSVQICRKAVRADIRNAETLDC